MTKIKMDNGKTAYQLKEVSEMGEFIKNKILALKGEERIFK